MKILVIDDDPRVAELIERYMERRDVSVTAVLGGREGVTAATAGDFDAIVLDIRMPGWDGFETLERLRERGVTAPILFLTASTEMDNLVRALEDGGDDFLRKPFELRELLARLQALVRRSGGSNGADVVLGKLRIDPVMHRAWWEDEPLDLTRIELRLLHALARTPGSPVSRSDLLAAGWGEEGNSERDSLTVHISNLRRRLAGVGAEDQLVTVRGTGYQLDF